MHACMHAWSVGSGVFRGLLIKSHRSSDLQTCRLDGHLARCTGRGLGGALLVALGVVELVGAAEVGGRLDELWVVRAEAARLGEHAAVLGEVDAEHDEGHATDDDAEVDEAVVERGEGADNELGAHHAAKVAAGADHAGDDAEVEALRHLHEEREADHDEHGEAERRLVV